MTEKNGGVRPSPTPCPGCRAEREWAGEREARCRCGRSGPVTVKELAVAALQEAGYDFFASCELYEVAKARFLASGRNRMRFFFNGGCAFTLARREGTQLALFAEGGRGVAPAGNKEGAI